MYQFLSLICLAFPNLLRIAFYSLTFVSWHYAVHYVFKLTISGTRIIQRISIYIISLGSLTPRASSDRPLYLIFPSKAGDKYWESDAAPLQRQRRVPGSAYPFEYHSLRYTVFFSYVFKLRSPCHCFSLPLPVPPVQKKYPDTLGQTFRLPI